MPADPELVDHLARHGQDHVLRFWDDLDSDGRARLSGQLGRLDLGRLGELVDRLVVGTVDEAPHPIEPSRVGPVDVRRVPQTDAERVARRHAAERGEAALAAGEVAAVLVAGGQGTRLGFDGPKGTYPIGPVSGASLFQLHAEKLRALGRRYGAPVPLYIMTSPENHRATTEFLDRHDQFGLEHVRLFVQGQMPAVDASMGKLLLAGKDRLALSPDGHGGTIAALASPADGGGPSCLDDMATRGVRTIYYFQVDNPLAQICDPAYLGLHLLADAEISFKVVEKQRPEEKVGVVVTVDGRAQVIEYSDLPAELAERREPDGSLELWAGSIAIHCFDRGFLERLASGGGRLPFHRALKKVPFLDESGAQVDPAAPNAVKFETFIFDALPLADRWSIVETERAFEFEPLKNATGPDSPATVRQRLSDLFGGWLEQSGARVLRRADGTVPFGIEISPLLALDAAELRQKVDPGLTVDRPIYLGPRDTG
ncbi:UTP--glucose-1-phosphate uridylyltransferase [Tautonia plasticadhaerens]|uniref:Putative uridylyltransferase n=1 Tax=Tautonia plasticadhaerens TaxID=2527974 RepID=A0A518H7A0_9BACT|nr:UTP--glucose-1-phosphate uridylyltransferase [Tautonia plasticadhaerens]QDV36712.1 putative uridylyltransferase [Tautonia plasticadhaerens]